MTLNSNITTEPPAARRFRLLAPLVVLLGLAALAAVPGILAEHGDDAIMGAAASQALSRLSALPVVLTATLLQGHATTPATAD